MGERRANILPRYAVRLRDLKPYHTLMAVRPACDHRASMRLWRITAGNPESTFLTTVERRLRCQRCGACGDATVLVTVTEEE